MALIRYNGKNILYYNFKLTIMPGINELETGVLDQMKKHPGFKQRFDSGLIQVVEEDPKMDNSIKKEGNKTHKSRNRDLEEMLRLIPDIFDKKLLERIIKSDRRDPVVNAAKEQLHKISIKAEDEEKNKSKKKWNLEKDKDEAFESSNP